MTEKKIHYILKQDLGLILLNLTILFYLFRTSFPLFKYPFVGILLFLLIYIGANYRKNIAEIIKVFVRTYWLIIILFFILLASFFLSTKIYLSVFKEIINSIILLLIFLMMHTLVKGKEDLTKFIGYFFELIILFGFFIAFTGITSQLGIFKYVLDDSVKIDYNFAVLPVLFGIISGFYLLLTKNLSSYKIVILNIILYISTFNVFFAGSRRGIIVLVLIIITLIISQFLSLFKKNNMLKKISYVSKYYLLAIVITSTFLFFFSTKSSCSFVNNYFDIIGTKYITKTKRALTANLHRYSTIFNKTESFQDFYSRIWSTEFDPKDPDCGWGFINGERYYPLHGEGIELLPDDAIGSFIDSSMFKSFVRKRRNILINSLDVNKEDRYKVEIYCFVSDDFDGKKVGLTTNRKFVKSSEGIRKDAFYDLNCKGTWQKLEYIFTCARKKVAIRFSIYRDYTKNTSFKGHIILAYPIITKVEPNDILPISYSNYEKSTFGYKQSISSISVKEDRNTILNFENSTSPDMQQASMLSILAPNSIIQTDKDPIRNLASKFISEDTVYSGYKNNLSIDTLQNKFSGSRINRWRFATQIYFKEYSWAQKILGNGFDFLNWYGYYFFHDKTRTDWPHNPVLGILLYSGALGLIIYLIVVVKAFYHYIRFIKDYFIVFVFFIITFFFSIFSSYTPFTPPIMGFLLIFPYFIHSVRKRPERENKTIEEKQI